MAPSTTRKEEAELRQVAKKARLARKEAKTRAHKQRLRAARSAATRAAGEGSKEVNTTITTTNAAQPKRKRQGAIILPDEVADLRRRLFDTAEKKGDEEDSNTTTTKVRGAKKAKKQAKGKDKAIVSPSKAASTSTQASAQSTHEEPNYHLEIHFKRKMVLVDVILHHVPHQKIDLSGCTPDKLVVDTTQHTKKYRLELPMPSGLRVNVEQSEFELENGVLHCRLPIANEDIPGELQAQWSALAEKMRAQKALRFHMKQDGQLTVRVRQALLPQESKVMKAAKTTKAERADDEADEDEVAKDNAEKQNNEQKKAATITATKDTKRPREATAEQASKSAKPPSTSTTTSKISDRKTSAPSKVDVFEQERIRALSVAKEAAKKARLTLKQRIELAKQVQQRRQARLEIRTERKTQKDARKQSTFARVLEEQKRQLLERAAHQAGIEAAEKKRAEAKKAGTASTKSVHFAQD